jgi:hypothetical protein
MSRTRKVQKNELTKLLTVINRRMEDFEGSVAELKNLKDTLDEVDDQLADQTRVNTYKMEQLKKELEENRIRTINNAVSEMGKIIISNEELDALKEELEKVRQDGNTQVSASIFSAKEQFEEKLKQALNVQQLQHDCKTAQLSANVDFFKKEVENLNMALNRMSEELSSQKQLTAEVAGMSRSRSAQVPSQ